MGYVILVNCPN